jgi:hypothetical protein
MLGVGRKGSLPLVYEIVVSLLLLGLFAGVVYLYIAGNANGASFWSKVYAQDLSTSAELALAGNGDVSLRYDNLKTTLNLGFWLTNGKVAVAKLPQAATAFEITTSGVRSETALDIGEPPGAAKGHYGLAQEYPRPGLLQNPSYLALRKIGTAFSIMPADLVDFACPAATPPVAKENARVQLEVKGSYTDEQKTQMLDALRAVLKDTPLQVVEKDGTIPITITRQQGQKLAVSFAPSGPAGARLSCLFLEKLQTITNSPFEGAAPSPSGASFGLDATITLTSNDQITPDYIGKAIGLALAGMY